MFDEGKIAYWLFSKYGIIAYALLMLFILALPVLERQNTVIGVDMEALALPLTCEINCEVTSK